MDKAGSVLKNINAAPAFESIMEVEFGCEHLQHFLEQDESIAQKLTNSYIRIQDLLFKPDEAQTLKNPKDSQPSYTTLRPTWLCMQCGVVATDEGRDSHADSRGHHFTVESRTGCLWCNMCNDFVYDPAFERIRYEQSQPLNTKKRKVHAISSGEDKFILPNTNALSCTAGGPRGIYNLGQTCYLSVILQSLVHNPLMRNYLFSARHETVDCPIDNCAICATLNSFWDILATEKIEGHGPIEMLHKSWKKDRNLEGYRQQDAHEYYVSLIDHLHKCSTRSNKKDIGSCTCLYHQIFSGKQRSTLTCSTCKTQSLKEEVFIDLSLDLAQQHKKRKVEAKEGEDDRQQDLLSCLKSYTSPERLSAEEYTCPSPQCGNTPQKAKKHLLLKKLPPTLCIQLKRYEHKADKSTSAKLNTKLRYPIQLDMSPYTTRHHRHILRAKASATENGFHVSVPLNGTSSPDPLTARSQGVYDLLSVVIHDGKIDAGHYICYCRRDDQWFKFDDAKVTIAGEKEVLAQEPYLLFYVIRCLPGETREKQKDEEVVDGEE